MRAHAYSATSKCMWAALDLHARHHFTAAAAVDGSMVEEPTPDGRLRRHVAYGVYEGARPGRSVGDGVWGGALTPDREVPDAEAQAIHAYLEARSCGVRARLAYVAGSARDGVCRGAGRVSVSTPFTYRTPKRSDYERALSPNGRRIFSEQRV